MSKAKSKSPKVRVLQLEHAKGLPLPTYQSEDAAGLDLIAAVPEDSQLVIEPGARFLVPTGLILELPPGTEAQVRPRSGLALKHGVTVLNSPGTIDSDYRGEVQVLLVNLSDSPFEIRRGERIAQMVVAAHIQVRLKAAETLRPTRRGSGGFGSTGRATAAAKPKANKKAMPPKSKSEAGGGERTRKRK